MDTQMLIEWFGYAATVVVATSLMMRSIIKLRWINMVGSLMFAVYGFVIGSWPVFILNSFIATINVFYLAQAYTQKEYFKLLDIQTTNLYMKDFLKYYEADIRNLIPGFNFEVHPNSESFFILRNMQVAGLFLGHRYDNDTLLIDLDFAIPEYRDFKLAKYLYKKQGDYFRSKGYKRLYSKTQSEKHNRYMRKLGFRPIQLDGLNYMVKDI